MLSCMADFVIACSIAPAFSWVSANSRTGLTSETIPEPDWTTPWFLCMNMLRMAMAKSQLPLYEKYPTAPAYGPRLCDSQFVYNLHGPHLGGSRNGPGGKYCLERIKHVILRTQLAYNVRDKMLHVAELFYDHQRERLDGTILAHPSHVVSAKVYKHRVFGQLLFVGYQLLCQSCGLLFCVSDGPCARYGKRLYYVSCGSDEASPGMPLW